MTSETPIGDAVAKDFAEFPVGLTDRGRAIFAGQNSLTLEESMSGEKSRDAAPAGPADAEQDSDPVTGSDPSTPVEGSDPPGEKETADDPSAADRETREN